MAVARLHRKTPDMIDLWVAGTPKPAERPRMTRRGRAYTPAATLEAEDAVATAYRRLWRGAEPLTGPLSLVVDYSPDGHRIHLWEWPATASSPMRGDVDNYLKTTMDGLQKAGAFLNDKQVVSVWARKWSSTDDIENMLVTPLPAPLG
jgi:Holliday junction resolvase RusA-like endonuclease